MRADSLTTVTLGSCRGVPVHLLLLRDGIDSTNYNGTFCRKLLAFLRLLLPVLVSQLRPACRLQRFLLSLPKI